MWKCFQWLLESFNKVLNNPILCFINDFFAINFAICYQLTPHSPCTAGRPPPWACPWSFAARSRPSCGCARGTRRASGSPSRRAARGTTSGSEWSSEIVAKWPKNDSLRSLTLKLKLRKWGRNQCSSQRKVVGPVPGDCQKEKAIGRDKCWRWESAVDWPLPLPHRNKIDLPHKVNQ